VPENLFFPVFNIRENSDIIADIPEIIITNIPAKYFI